MDQDKREKARLASQAYRDRDGGIPYKETNRLRYWKDKEKKEQQMKNVYDLSNYPEEDRKKIVKYIKHLEIIKKTYPELLNK